MGFTVKNIAGGATNGFADSVSATLVGTPVSTGDLVVAWCGWALDGLSWTVSDSTSTFEQGLSNSQSSWSPAHGQFLFLPFSVASGFQTYTFDIPGAFGPQIIVYIFGTTGAVVVDTQVADQGLGGAGSTSPDSGALPTLTGTDTLILGGMMAENSPIYSAQTIGGGAATGEGYLNAGAFAHEAFYQTGITGTPSAAATLNTAQKWLANAISFKIPSPSPVANKVGSLLMAYQ